MSVCILFCVGVYIVLCRYVYCFVSVCILFCVGVYIVLCWCVYCFVSVCILFCVGVYIVLCWCVHSSSHTEESKLRVFENRVLRKIFGPKRYKVTRNCTRLHKEDLNEMH